jgi:sugar lactone lactonase YvrE
MRVAACVAGLVVACAVGVAGCSGGTSQPGPVSPAPPTAVAGGYVYWANNASNTIGRARLDGSAINQNLITGLGSPAGLAVSGRYLYWADSARNAIGRARLDGSGADRTFMTGMSGPSGIAVYGGHLYWAASALPAPG